MEPASARRRVGASRSVPCTTRRHAEGERPVRRWNARAKAAGLPNYLAYTWWTAAIALRGVAAIAPYVLLVPIVGGLFALVWLGETVGLLSGAGAALTLLGLAQSRGWLPRCRRRRARG